MWTKSEDGITESGGFISEWADQSGNNNDFDNTTAGKPFYNTTGTTLVIYLILNLMTLMNGGI